VPLSENEQRLLEQMERALYDEDPKFASSLRGADLRSHVRKRLLVAGTGFAVGVVGLLAGVVTQVLAVSVLGFLLMLGFAWLGVTAWKRLPAPGEAGSFTPPAGGGRKRKASNAGLVQRAEERWRRRRDEMGR
jgi:hypothetical protein